MKQLFTSVLAVLLISSSFSQTWSWAKSYGGNSYDDGNAIAVDAAGNSYVTGSFQDTAIFGSFTLIADGDADIFTAKFDPSGNCLWVKKGGGLYGEAGYGICLDGANNVYITGSYNASPLTFGSFTLPLAVWNDIFLVKYDNNGNEQWAVKAGGSMNDYGYGLAFDGSNSIYMVGNFEGTGTFGSNSISSAGWGDIVVAKYDISNGNCTWAVKGGGNGNDNGKGIYYGAGNIYVTGYFRNTGTFGALPALSATGLDEMFAAKLDPNGTWLWAVKGGGPMNDAGLAVTADAGGTCFVTGYYDGSGTFGTASLTSQGSQDIFISKYNANGVFQMAKSHGGWANDKGFGILIDLNGDIILAGEFEGTATFDLNTIQVLGISDFYVARCNAMNGNSDWVVKGGAEDEDKLYGMSKDAANDIYITGYYRLNCEFLALPTLAGPNGRNEVYIAKLTYPLSVEENAAGSQFTLFPNPANSQLNVNNTSGAKWTCYVMDEVGRVLLKEMFHSNDGSLNIEGLAPGIYFIEILTEGITLSGKAKFVKN